MTTVVGRCLKIYHVSHYPKVSFVVYKKFIFLMFFVDAVFEFAALTVLSFLDLKFQKTFSNFDLFAHRRIGEWRAILNSYHDSAKFLLLKLMLSYLVKKGGKKMHSLSKLSDQDLLDKTKKLVLEETQKTLEVLNHLREVERRKLYLKSGFPSLFEYTVHELKYSHSAAYRRIEAMRLIKDLPEVENKILKGSLNLTTASLAQSFFKKQVGFNKQSNKDEKLNLIKKLENKSTRDVQKELVSLDPEFIPKEKLRPLNENTFELKLVIDEKLKSKLDKLKSLMSHKNPSFNYQDLIDELANQALKKLDHSLKSQRRALPALKVENKNSRYIPALIKQQIWKRDQGKCQYEDAKLKRRCNSTHFIQIDHIKPYSQNGSSQDPQNLRLLCGQHNRWRYKQEGAT